MIEKAEIYNFVSVKYKDGVIFVSLKRIQRFYTLFNNLVNLYIAYKIKARGKEFKEIYSIRKDEIILNKNHVILKIELSEIQSIEQTSLEIETLQFNLLNKSKLTIPIFQSFTFLELQQDILHLPNISLTPTTTIDSPVIDKKLVLKEKKDETLIMEQIENAIDSNQDFELKNQLEMDIKHLCFKIINLTLSNLPKPKVEDDYFYSTVMIDSIKKFINADLLRQKESEEEGVESA